MKSELRLSVALVTRNRPGALVRSLESLRAQSVQPYEVVVSDDSTPEFAAETARIAERFGCRYVEGPKRGLYANRNAAALQCCGTHLRTMDDDHTFPPGHFELCLAAMEKDPGAVWTTGESCYVDGRLHGRFETASQLTPAGVGGPVRDPDDNWAVADGSTIYPIEIFGRGLRMLETFGYGSSYLEFGAFLYRHGYRSRCVAGALVDHHADRATVGRNNLESCLFASLCHNLYFERNLFLAGKYLAAYAVFRRPSLLAGLPPLFKQARARWGGLRREPQSSVRR